MRINRRKKSAGVTLCLLLFLCAATAAATGQQLSSTAKPESDNTSSQAMQVSSTPNTAVTGEEGESHPVEAIQPVTQTTAAGGKGSLRNYLYDTFGPGTWIAAGILAGRDQGRNRGSDTKPHGEPPEWGQGAEGYGDRYASRFGQVVISQTVRYGTGTLLREDVAYHPCQCSGFLPRMGHVFVGSYTAKTASGSTVFSIPNLIGPLAAGQIAVAGWYPSRFDQRQGLRLAVPLLMGGPIRNTVREFLGR